MNRPCKIHFHEDAAPLYEQLPERYQKYVCDPDLRNGDVVPAIFSQNAFFIDFTNGTIIRTRVTGEKEADPIDFPVTSISFVEWYYGTDVPPPLKPFIGRGS
jgi:hypothetical protein